MIKDKLEQLYETEMSRYDFLKYVGVIFLSVIGVTGLLHALTQTQSRSPGTAVQHGYGSSPYGGTSTSGAQLSK
jgi:hypothetical protein